MPKDARHCGSVAVSELVEQFNKLQTNVATLINNHNALVTLVNDIKAKFNAHTHSITHAACAATSAAYPSATTITTTSGPSTTVANGTTSAITADKIQLIT